MTEVDSLGEVGVPVFSAGACELVLSVAGIGGQSGGVGAVGTFTPGLPLSGGSLHSLVKYASENGGPQDALDIVGASLKQVAHSVVSVTRLGLSGEGVRRLWAVGLPLGSPEDPTEIYALLRAALKAESDMPTQLVKMGGGWEGRRGPKGP